MLGLSALDFIKELQLGPQQSEMITKKLCMGRSVEISMIFFFFNPFQSKIKLVKASIPIIKVIRKGSIGSRVQLVRGFNWFEGSIGLSVQLLQGFNFLKGSLGSSSQTL